MRRYDDPVEVRRGMVGQTGRQIEAPEQFLWRGKLWKVREVIAHWVETGPWWQSAGARAAIGVSAEGAGADPGADPGGGSESDLTTLGVDLLAERELWRVEAGSGMNSRMNGAMNGVPRDGGVFDLAFSWTDGTWQLLGCVD